MFIKQKWCPCNYSSYTFVCRSCFDASISFIIANIHSFSQSSFILYLRDKVSDKIIINTSKRRILYNFYLKYNDVYSRLKLEEPTDEDILSM